MVSAPTHDGVQRPESTCRLATLPRELRDAIYDHVLDLDQKDARPGSRLHAILYDLYSRFQDLQPTGDPPQAVDVKRRTLESFHAGKNCSDLRLAGCGMLGTSKMIRDEFMQSIGRRALHYAPTSSIIYPFEATRDWVKPRICELPVNARHLSIRCNHIQVPEQLDFISSYLFHALLDTLGKCTGVTQLYLEIDVRPHEVVERTCRVNENT